MSKKEKMSLPALKELILNDFVPSSLNVVNFCELRTRYKCSHITDVDFIGVIKSCHFELFGSSGAWIKLKQK